MCIRDRYNIIVYCSTSRNHQPLRITVNIASTNNGGITFLEHIVINMSLTVGGYTTRYDYSDYNDEVKRTNSKWSRIHTWLKDDHPRRGDIKVLLTSPQGTTSTLLPYRTYDFVNAHGYYMWPFMSVHHWGENPSGQWTLTINFKSSSGYVSMSGLQMTLYGTTQMPQAVANIPSVCDLACARSCSGPGQDHCDACRHLRIASTLQCVTNCPNGTTPYNGYCLGEL